MGNIFADGCVGGEKLNAVSGCAVSVNPGGLRRGADCGWNSRESKPASDDSLRITEFRCV